MDFSTKIFYYIIRIIFCILGKDFGPLSSICSLVFLTSFRMVLEVAPKDPRLKNGYKNQKVAPPPISNE